jgi:hypothetical protein
MTFSALIFTKLITADLSNAEIHYLIPIFTKTGQAMWKVRVEFQSRLQVKYGCH